MRVTLDDVSTSIETAKNWGKNMISTPTVSALAQNWEPVPKEERDGYDWVEMNVKTIGKAHIHRPTGDVYPVQSPAQSAWDTAKVFYGARYYFGLNVVGDIAAYASKVYALAKDSSDKISFDPRGLFNSQEGRRFVVNLLGFSYSSNLPTYIFSRSLSGMPGVLEFFSVSDWIDPPLFGFRPSTIFGIARYALLGYALYNPLITRVALNRFEKWRYPKETKPLSIREFKQLSPLGMLKAVYKGEVTPSALIGIKVLGTVKESPVVTATTIEQKKEE